MPETIEAREAGPFPWPFVAALAAWALVDLALAAWLSVAAGLALAAVLVVVAVAVFRRRRRPRADRAPVLRVGPEGYHDRRLGAPIPWARVRDLRRLRRDGRHALRIGVDDPAAFLGAGGGGRVDTPEGPALVSVISDLDVEPDRVARAAAAWLAAARGRR